MKVAAAVAVGKKIFVMGGTTLIEYNTETHSWMTRQSPPHCLEPGEARISLNASTLEEMKVVTDPEFLKALERI